MRTCDKCGRSFDASVALLGLCYGSAACPAVWCPSCVFTSYDGDGKRVCKFHKAERVLTEAWGS